MLRISSVVSILLGVVAVFGCQTGSGLHCDVYGAPAAIEPITVACTTASDCIKGFVVGKKAYASLSLLDPSCLSPLNATNEHYSNSPYKTGASTPVVCADNQCTAAAAWLTTIPTGNYFLFAFIDTNGDGLPTPQHDNVPGEPGITISPALITASTAISASGSLWYNIDATNNYAK